MKFVKPITFALALLLAVATWQVDMAVTCAHRCVRRPRVVQVEKPRATVPPCSGPQCQLPEQPRTTVSPTPQCRGPQCQMPKSLPAQPSSSR